MVGWQHPFYTAFIGIGLALARFQSNSLLQLILIASGWGVAVITHAVHNTITTLATGAGGLVFGTFLDWSGWLIMFCFIMWAIHREKNWIKTHLLEEIAFGSITHAQYRTTS